MSLGYIAKVAKNLSPNDIGKTGSHQAGILIPKSSTEIIDFFPSLDSSQKNPRKSIRIVDPSNYHWVFNYIYYNNKFFGGTRNEYRLTGTTPFMKFHGLASGDELIFEKDFNGTYTVNFSKASRNIPVSKLRLSNKWKVIPLRQ